MPVDLLPENIEAVQSFLREKGWIDDEPSVTVATLTSAGEGNMNRTYRATLSDGSTLVLKQSVPFVAKYPQIAAPVGRLDVETAFYRAVAAAAAASSSSASGDELSTKEKKQHQEEDEDEDEDDDVLVQKFMPKILHYDPTERLLCLEDLGTGGDMTEAYKQRGDSHSSSTTKKSVFTAQHRELLLKWLAALHSIRIDDEGDDVVSSILVNMDMRELNHAHIFDIPLQPDNGIDLDAITPGLKDVAAAYTSNQELRDRAKSLGDLYLGRGGGDGKSSGDVLLHGDFFPGSFLSNDTTGVKVIDPEFGFLGPAEFDLGVFVAHCVFCGVSDEDIEGALRNYGRPYDRDLMFAFAGMEIVRRLLGVAQLPLPSESTTLDDKKCWLEKGCDWLMAWSP